MGIKIAICQFGIKWENKEENIASANIFIREAAKNQADIILFPEMSFTGFSMNIEITKEVNEFSIKKMKESAIKEGIAIGFGWVKAIGNQAENHYSIIDSQGCVISDYVKMHSFGYGGEKEQFIEGNEIKTFIFKDFSFTPFICYDLRFPEIFREAMDKTDIYIVPANWPASRDNHWKILLQARAVENQAYVLGINCVGQVGDLYYCGNSCVINPNGMIIQNTIQREELIYADIKCEDFSIRESFPVGKDRKIKK